MNYRFSHGVMALLASTALTTAQTAIAQEEIEPSESTTEQAADQLRQDTIVIRGEFIPDEKRETSEISSLLDAEDFAIQGDSDVAGALRRVTGVSIADSKFVYVRGLNERYSSSTLNGSPLPSPEPLRRVAPLDLFPTSVLESLIVQKTYSPEYSAEFGGGNVDIRTKAVPLEGFLTIGGSIGGNTETSFQDGLLYDGGGNDYLGYDDGTRDLSGTIEGLLNTGSFDDQSFADRAALSSELVDDSSLLVMQEGYVGPDFGFNVTGGERFDFNNALSMGVIAAASYSNEWKTKQGKSGIGFLGSADAVTQGKDFDRYSTTNNIGVSGMASVGFDILQNHELKFLGFVTRSTDKEAQSDQGIDSDSGNFQRIDALTWVERQLWTTQVQGESTFPMLADLKVNWRGSYSEAERDAPYDFQSTYTEGNDGTLQLQGGTDTRFRFSNILDDTTDFGIDLLLPLYFGSVSFDVKAGYAYVEKDRETNSFDFRPSGVLPSALRDLRVDYALNGLINDFSGVFVSPPSQQSPDYSIATLEVDAGYLGFDTQLTSFMRVALGARYEDSIEVVETRAYPTAVGTISNPIEESRWLPAGTLTWNFADDLQLRVGYSETVTRPQFRELSPTFFQNQETDIGFFGNRYLQDAELSNYDARLEYYFGRDQFVTVGGFYKEMENVIEEVLTSDENATTTFVNIPKAELYGIELEYQQSIPLGAWTNWGWMQSKDFSFKTNYTWSQSELSYPEAYQVTLTARTPDASALLQDASLFLESGRAMSGQSDHLANLQFGYSGFEAGSEANLLLNYASERIRFGANFTGARRPAIIETPPISLDFVYNRDFVFLDGDYSFGLKLTNLLDDDFDWSQEAGDTSAYVNTYDLGRSISLSLKKSF